jgi:hypothetical protein
MSLSPLQRNVFRRWCNCKITRHALSNREHRFAAIVSSHSRRTPEWSIEWKNRLIWSLMECKRRDETVLYSLKTPIGFWIQSFARQIAVDCVQVVDQSDQHDAHENFRQSFIAYEECNEANDPQSDLSHLPIADRTLFALADRVYILRADEGSKTEQLAIRWNDIRRNDETDRRLIVFSGSIPATSPLRSFAMEVAIEGTQRTSSSLMWHAHCAAKQAANLASACHSIIITHDGVEQSRLNSDDYLVHCTRGRGGPYPNQSVRNYADEMLLHAEDVDASPFDTLNRILIERRLLPTSFLKIDQSPSISFSQVPLLELLKRRSYQRHVKRWDWEPYGIAIRKQVLVERFETREVIYHDGNADKIDESQRWLCQPSTDRSGQHDWRSEREWRCPKPIRLSELKYEEAFVFVHSHQDARKLSNQCPFAIAITNKACG